MRVLCGLAVLFAVSAHATTTWVVRRETRVADVLDAYLWQSSPDSNSGGSTVVYTGLVGAGDKEALLRFDVSFVPRGAVVTKANVVLHTGTDGLQPVGVYAVTVPWEEDVVTWNRFDAGYAVPAVVKFFPAAPTFSIAPLVQQWVDGRRNDGLLLQQAPGSNYATFSSSNESDVALRPRLELQFTPPRPEETLTFVKTDAGEAGFGDAYIWEGAPDVNHCCTGSDTAGFVAPGEKVALVRFGLGALPAGSTIESAVLWLNHDPGSAADENRVRASPKAWDESTVTWNSYGGGPSGEPDITFSPATDGGATPVEVRSIVQAWVDGAPNHGFVLDEAAGAPATWWHSFEGPPGLRPRLEVRFVRPYVDAGTPGGDGGGAVDAGTNLPQSTRWLSVGCSSVPPGQGLLALALLLSARERSRRRGR